MVSARQRWWPGPSGWTARPAGSPAPVPVVILTAAVPVMALLPLAALLLLLRLISERPFAGPDLAFLVLAVNLVVVLPLWVLASLDRARRRRRPAAWYRFLAGVALLLLLVDLSAVPAALALPSGVVGPRYTRPWSSSWRSGACSGWPTGWRPAWPRRWRC
jgi:hypothetical protein